MMQFLFASQSLASTGDNTVAFVAATRVSIVEVGVLITTALDSDALTEVRFESTPHSGGTRGDGNVAVLARTGTTAGDIASVGKCWRKTLDVGLDKGDRLHVEVTNAGTAGAGIPYIVFQDIGSAKNEPADVASN